MYYKEIYEAVRQEQRCKLITPLVRAASPESCWLVKQCLYFLLSGYLNLHFFSDLQSEKATIRICNPLLYFLCSSVSL